LTSIRLCGGFNSVYFQFYFCWKWALLSGTVTYYHGHADPLPYAHMPRVSVQFIRNSLSCMYVHSSSGLTEVAASISVVAVSVLQMEAQFSCCRITSQRAKFSL